MRGVVRIFCRRSVCVCLGSCLVLTLSWVVGSGPGLSLERIDVCKDNPGPAVVDGGGVVWRELVCFFLGFCFLSERKTATAELSAQKAAGQSQGNKVRRLLVG